jgi:hypothetical protein
MRVFQRHVSLYEDSLVSAPQNLNSLSPSGVWTKAV